MEQNKNNGLVGGVVLAALAASLCCVIPLLFAGAGATAIVLANKFDTVRPYLLAVTGLLLAAGFYFAYRPAGPACEPESACATPSSVRRARLGLWLAAAFAVVLTTIPYWSAAVIRISGQVPNPPVWGATARFEKTTLHVSGLICQGCAALIENQLKEQPGVRSARVSFAQSTVEVEYEPSKISLEELRSVIEKAGYRVAELASPRREEG